MKQGRSYMDDAPDDRNYDALFDLINRFLKEELALNITLSYEDCFDT